MDDVHSTEALQDEMQQLAERYARMVCSYACPLPVYNDCREP